MDYLSLHTSGHGSLEAIKLEKEIFQNRLLDFQDGDIVSLTGEL